MESTQEQAETADKEPTAEKAGTGESLKVYVRVRPRLKNEFLKEAAAFVDTSVNFSSKRDRERVLRL